MAKQNTHPQLEDILVKAEISQQSEDIYSNYVRVTAAMNEFTLDFYRLSPALGRERSPHAVHAQRITIPANIAKGLVSALNEVIDHYEKEFGITLINERESNHETVIGEQHNE